MSKITMVSLQRHNHNGTWYVRDEQFEANSESEVADLECMNIAKRAKRKTDAVEAPAQVVETREVKAEESAKPAAPAAKSGTLSLPPKGQYSRRDVRAVR